MLPELNAVNYINRLDGAPLFYSSSFQGPFNYYPTSVKNQKLSSPIHQNYYTLTPPLSPNYQSHQTQVLPKNFGRSSVIMKVENHQIKPNDNSPSDDHEVCKWANCYR